MKEEDALLHDMPEPRGNPVDINVFVDADCKPLLLQIPKQLISRFWNLIFDYLY